MGTVTKSIGTTSRDYSTITAWEADLDNVAVYASGDHAVGECYNDSAFDESVTINGGGTVGLASVTLTVASGHRHDGTAGTGARITRGTFSDAYIIDIARPTCSVQWLEVDQNQNTGGTVGAACKGTESAGQTAMDWRYLIVHGVRYSSSFTRGITAQVDDSVTHNTINCIVYDIISAGNRDAIGIGAATAGRTVNCLNCTVHDVYTNSAGDPAYCYEFGEVATFTLRNLIGTNAVNDGAFGAGCFSDSSYGTTTADHNLSSDATASGTGSLVSKAAANQFVSTVSGSEDLHLKLGADAIDAGTDLGTTPAGVQYDIDGRDRDALGDVWDIGADEYVAAAGGSTAYILGGGVF